MDNNAGGVAVIGTLVPTKPGKYPVVRGCDVGLSNGDNLESFLKKHVNSETMTDDGGDIVTEVEINDTPFEETNKKNNIRIRLKKNGKQVFCTITSSLQLPDHGVLILDNVKIPKEFTPIFPVFMPFVAEKNGRNRGPGHFIISSRGIINIFSETDEDANRSTSTSWIVG